MGKSVPHSSGIPSTTLQRASGVGQGGKVGAGKEGDALEHPSQARNLLGILLIDEPHLPAPKNGLWPLGRSGTDRENRWRSRGQVGQGTY